jgi:hypothetical protein
MRYTKGEPWIEERREKHNEYNNFGHGGSELKRKRGEHIYKSEQESSTVLLSMDGGTVKSSTSGGQDTFIEKWLFRTL